MKLWELGEREIINRLASVHSGSVQKDDCALIDNGDSYFMVSTDVITPDTHIPAGTSPELAGSFFASINLSDIAGMAGEPTGFMTAYVFPRETEMEYLDGIESGISKVLKKFGVDQLGGDTKEGLQPSMTGIALGRQKKELTRRRGDIRDGQILGVTNTLGRAAAGYVFYRTGYKKDAGIRMMMGAEPRIKEAALISEYGGKFMMDLSDGVFSSAQQMKADYGLGFKLVEDEVRAEGNVEKAAELSGASMRDLLFSYGGDYEILFSVENDNYGDFIDAMESNKVDVSIIGQVWDGDNIIFDGERWETVRDSGYEHFKNKPALGKIR